VATRVGGIPELVTDEVSGYLVKRGDPAAAAEKLDNLANDPNLRRALGAAGRRIVQEKFDLKRNVAQLTDLYDLS
jgi:colanic acid/amylovoran biosynthesis glycosyltransferase